MKTRIQTLAIKGQDLIQIIGIDSIVAILALIF
jgi:hypothetical protein